MWKSRRIFKAVAANRNLKIAVEHVPLCQNQCAWLWWLTICHRKTCPPNSLKQKPGSDKHAPRSLVAVSAARLMDDMKRSQFQEFCPSRVCPFDLYFTLTAKTENHEWKQFQFDEIITVSRVGGFCHCKGNNWLIFEEKHVKWVSGGTSNYVL